MFEMINCFLSEFSEETRKLLDFVVKTEIASLEQRKKLIWFWNCKSIEIYFSFKPNLTEISNKKRLVKNCNIHPVNS